MYVSGVQGVKQLELERHTTMERYRATELQALQRSVTQYRPSTVHEVG